MVNSLASRWPPFYIKEPLCSCIQKFHLITSPLSHSADEKEWKGNRFSAGNFKESLKSNEYSNTLITWLFRLEVLRLSHIMCLFNFIQLRSWWCELCKCSIHTYFFNSVTLLKSSLCGSSIFALCKQLERLLQLYWNFINLWEVNLSLFFKWKTWFSAG